MAAFFPEWHEVIREKQFPSFRVML